MDYGLHSLMTPAGIAEQICKEKHGGHNIRPIRICLISRIGFVYVIKRKREEEWIALTETLLALRPYVLG
ncbi:hypothetical protein RJ641_011243 [Dillenia turbinata]|uniref:Uncharacterized protein n=1 Tax=Dillenia turbinata TaxID=194707 RepID=A0AAN8V131_9MAGN